MMESYDIRLVAPITGLILTTGYHLITPFQLVLDRSTLLFHVVYELGTAELWQRTTTPMIEAGHQNSKSEGRFAVPVPESVGGPVYLHRGLDELLVEQQVLALPLRRAGAASTSSPWSVLGSGAKELIKRQS
jgi:hypothetical protein